MNYKLWIKVWTICTYSMWFGLFLSIIVEGQVFFKLGIVMASIVSPMALRMFRELDLQNVEKR